MEVKAITKYARISPLKARDVAREIQGLSASQALDILSFTPRKAARIISKTLKSALANAEHNFSLSTENLVVKQAVALTGPAFGRIKPMARGSAGAIRKPTAHIQIVLAEGAATKGPRVRGESRAAQSGAPKKRAAAAE
jgi:large subunit ribosomal protein L22